MDGNFKSIVFFIFFIVFMSCEKRQLVADYKNQEILKSNINYLLDSLDFFDWTKIPVPNNFKNVKKRKMKIELIDSILFEENTFVLCSNKFNDQFNIGSKFNIQNYKIDKSTIENINLKDVNLVKIGSNDIYTLTVTFSNLLISKTNNYACIVVTKKIGVSMKKDLYFFERKRDKWIYAGRKNLLIG